MMDGIKEQTRQDLIDFFESEGGHTRVAEKIGLTPQTLRNVKIGRNDVTLAILIAISQAYPDNEKARKLLARAVGLDENMPSASVQAVAQAQVPPVVSETAEDIIQKLTNQLVSLSERYERLEDKYENTRESFTNYKDAVIRKYAPELSFSKSGNQPTAEVEQDRVAMGFVIKGEALVLPLGMTGRQIPFDNRPTVMGMLG